MKIAFIFSLIIFTLNARNPFIFSYEELRSPVACPSITQEDKKIFSANWKVIGCDGNKLTIKNIDGTIRTVSLIHEDNFPKRNPSNLR